MAMTRLKSDSQDWNSFIGNFDLCRLRFFAIGPAGLAFSEGGTVAAATPQRVA
jgi:hypothetical protein